MRAPYRDVHVANVKCNRLVYDTVRLKGVGRIYQQTFIDTYAKVGFAKLYDRKTPITAADLLNDRVLPKAVQCYEIASSVSILSIPARAAR